MYPNNGYLAMSSTKRIRNKTMLLYAAEISLALSLIYTLFYLASSLSLHFYVLVKRGMLEQTVMGNILSGPLDTVVWSIAIFVILIWIGYNLGSTRLRSSSRPFPALSGLVLLCGLGVWVILGILGFVSIWSMVLISILLLGIGFVFALNLFGVNRLSLFLRVLFGGLLIVLMFELASFVLFNVPVAFGLGVGSLGLHWSGVELAFSNLAYPFLTYVYLLLVLLGIGAFVFRTLPNSWSWLVARVKCGRLIDKLNGFLGSGEGRGFGFDFLGGRGIVVLAVVVSAAISCLFVVFTVLPWSNPTGMMVSQDSPVYYSWVTHMRSIDVNSALTFAFGNDRAVFLVLCYALSFVFPTASVIQFSAAFLLVMLIVVSVFILKLFTSSRRVLVLGALLVPFSFQGLGLIYAGYFANMLALILIFVYIVLFFKLIEKWSTLNFFVLLGVSVLILFSHSWTWFVFALTILMFLFLEWRSIAGDRRLMIRFRGKALLVGTTVGVGFAIDLVRRFLSPVSSSASALGTAQSSLGFPNPAFLMSGLKQFVEAVNGGVYANQLLVVFSFVGFLILLRFKSEVSRFFISWMFVIFVSILFAAESFVFDRSLFILPWLVLSSLGLAFGIGFVSHRVGQTSGLKSFRLVVVLLALAFVVLVLLNFSFRYLFNINIW